MNNDDVMSGYEWKDLLENVPCGIGIFEVTEHWAEVLYLNDGFYQMIGRPRKERDRCSGKEDCFFYVHPDDRAQLEEHYKALYEGKDSCQCEFRIDLGTDEYYWVDLRYKVARREKDRVIAYGTYSDINRVKCSELAAVKRYNEEIAIRDSLPNTLATFRMDITSGRIEASHINVPEGKALECLTRTDDLVNNEFCLVDEEEDRAAVKRVFTLDYLLQQYDQGENHVSLTYRRRMLNGEYRWIGTNLNLLKRLGDGNLLAFVCATDITERKIMEGMMESIISVHYDYLMSIDLRTGKYMMYRGANGDDMWKESAGYYNDDLLKQEGKCLREEWERCKAYMNLEHVCRQLEKKNTYSVYLGVKGRDGTVRRKKITYSRIGKKLEFAMMTRVDVTDLHESEQEKNKQLTAALAQAEKANRAKSDFLSHMSHEIRTPLNGIKGMIDLMREKEEFQGNDYLEKVRLSTRYLMRLINDILDMSKIESGKIELERDILTVSEFCSSIDAVIKPLADEKYITYGCKLAKTLHEGIFVDAGRFKQIMLNLLSNAIKYTGPYGEVSYYIEQADVPPNRAHLSLVVEDNGVGMSKEFMETVFDPFTQERRSYTYSGTGLGLAITKQLIELMGGTIRIQSQEGMGTKVFVDLETEWTDNLEVLDREGKIVSKRYHFETLDFTGRRALLVEDNEINMEIAQLQLQNIGLEVLTARDGSEAVNTFQQVPEGFYDIVFMDIMMPVMDGLEATKVIRGLGREDVKTVPIVAMTANAFVEDIHKSLESGMDYHLSKPFEKEQMLQILAQAFFIK